MGDTYAEKQPATITPPSSQPFFPPNVQKQTPGNVHKVDPADVTNYLSMINLEEANKSNIRNLNQFSNERYLLCKFFGIPMAITTSKPASSESEDISPLTLEIAKWQYDYI